MNLEGLNSFLIWYLRYGFGSLEYVTCVLAHERPDIGITTADQLRDAMNLLMTRQDHYYWSQSNQGEEIIAARKKSKKTKHL